MADELTPEGEEGSVSVRHDLAHMPMIDPAAKGGLLGVLRRRYLLSLMVKRELRVDNRTHAELSAL
jgi:ABC-2 type transport system permease protein